MKRIFMKNGRILGFVLGKGSSLPKTDEHSPHPKDEDGTVGGGKWTLPLSTHPPKERGGDHRIPKTEYDFVPVHTLHPSKDREGSSSTENELYLISSQPYTHLNYGGQYLTYKITEGFKYTTSKSGVTVP